MMHDETNSEDVRIDSLDFVERTRAPLRSLNGLKLAGSEVDEIACYLTGRRDHTGLWGISEYQMADKHETSYPINRNVVPSLIRDVRR